MADVDAHALRRFLLNEQLPGTAYALIWADLDEQSEAYAALSEVMFDYDETDDLDNAPVRNLADPKVRAGVVDCAMRYPEIAAAAAKLMREIRRPWWKFW
jgi:hypothetical protein